jgi:hypothetical protein
MPTTMTATFQPLPTGFQLPASNPPYPPHGWKRPRARIPEHSGSNGLRYRYASSKPFRSRLQFNTIALAVRWLLQRTRGTPRCMTNTNLAKTETKPKRERPISKKLVQAIDSLLDGTCRNQKSACERYKLSPSYLSRSMRKDKIRVYVARRTSEAIAASQLPATATVLRLMENAKSEHVQFDAAQHMLGLNGYHANPSAPGVNINIGDTPSGYIIRLGSADAEVYEGQISSVGGVEYGRKLTDEERRTGQLIPSHPGTMIDVTPNRRDDDQ